MGVAGELSLESGPLQLHQNIQVFGDIKHLNTETVTITDITSTQFYFLYVWQAGELTYGIREVVSFLAKSDVGWDTICSKGGGFQIAGSVPTERGTGLTSRKGDTPKCSIPTEVEGSDVPCRLRLRGIDSVVGLTLFLGGFSSEDKTNGVGPEALFLSAVDDTISFIVLAIIGHAPGPNVHWLSPCI